MSQKFKTWRWTSYPGPIQWNHFQADLIWPDGTFKNGWKDTSFVEQSAWIGGKVLWTGSRMLSRGCFATVWTWRAGRPCGWSTCRTPIPRRFPAEERECSDIGVNILRLFGAVLKLCCASRSALMWLSWLQIRIEHEEQGNWPKLTNKPAFQPFTGGFAPT
jgi:hypothetical protein